MWRSMAEPRLRPVGTAILAAYGSYVGVFNYLSNLPASSEFYLQIQQRFWPQVMDNKNSSSSNNNNNNNNNKNEVISAGDAD